MMQWRERLIGLSKGKEGLAQSESHALVTIVDIFQSILCYSVKIKSSN
jgi:hypothetical protein